MTTTEAATYLSELIDGQFSPEAIAAERSIAQRARTLAMSRVQRNRANVQGDDYVITREISLAFDAVIEGQRK